MTDKVKKSLLNGALEIRLSRFKLLDGHMRAEAQAKLKIEEKMSEDCPQCRHCTHAIVETVQLLERDEIAVRAFCKVKTGVCVADKIVATVPALSGVTTSLDDWMEFSDFRKGGFVSDVLSSSVSAHRQGVAFDINGTQTPFRPVNKDAPRTVAEEVW